MKLTPKSRFGLTLIEMLLTTVLIGVLGLVLYSLLSVGTTLGAKNTAMNTSHQQARMALLQMTKTLHAAVSAPQLVDLNGNPTLLAPAPGISFQLWAGGPYQITADTGDVWQNGVTVNVTDKPFTGATQRLIIPGYQLETDINSKPSNTTGTTTLTPTATPFPTPTPVRISVPGASPAPAPSINCFLTNRCYYIVNNGALEWHFPDPATGLTKIVVLATGISSATPFTLSGEDVTVTLAGEDSHYDNYKKQQDGSWNGKFQSTGFVLREIIPVRSVLTTSP